MEDHDYNEGEPGATKMPRNNESPEDQYFNRIIEKKYEKIFRACDKKSNLYILQQKLLIQGNNVPSQGKSNCSRWIIG